MAQDVAFLHRGHEAIEEVKVGTADSRRGDLHHDVATILDPSIQERLGAAVQRAVSLAYTGRSGHPGAHRFLQRGLYRINRLMLFWGDDLGRYENDRSPLLNAMRAHIESAWQSWERNDHDRQELAQADASQALQSRIDADLSRPPSPTGVYFRERATLPAYQHRLIARWCG
ncbi:MAG: hypothetical protein ABR538_09615 [Candidatus Binatia bacterium]